MSVRRLALAALLTCTFAVSGAHAQVDLSMMHGRPLPTSELPAGTVTVRVVRETMANNVVGQQVTLTAGGTSRHATTDAQGRAEFTGLTPGVQGRVETLVDGEQLVSEPFTIPGSGGLRIALIAGLKSGSGAAEAGPAVTGGVVLAGGTRVVTEFQSDVLRVFYMLELVNRESSPVDPGEPFVLELPERAVGAALIENPPKSATVDGRRLTVYGPFAPGSTRVDVAFELDYSGSTHTMTQVWPVPVEELVVGVERVNGLTVTSPQFRAAEERVINGSVFLVAAGTPLAAGSPLTLQFSNLPTPGRLAPTVAILAALGVAGLGIWLSLSAPRGAGAGRQALEARRRTLLARLEALERSHRAGSVSADKYASRRERLVRDLEAVYGELDVAGSVPGGDGRGVAA